jgi:nicotinate-nucleotide--dimethylbenzimidazole phosphoribosyltransferase
VVVQDAEDIAAALDIADLAGRIVLPDEDARRAALDLVAEPGGALGRLGELAGWLAAVQGRSPAVPFVRIRVVAVGAEPPEPVRELAGSGTRVVEVPATVNDAEAGFRAGLAAADAEVDAGADLLVLTGGTAVVPAATLVAVLTSTDVASVVGHRPGEDDRDWMRTCAAVRDSARLGRPLSGEVLKLLTAVEAAEAATAAGVVVEAAVRRTPLVLDDLVPATAALVAQRISYRTTRWLVAAHRTTDPAHSAALERLRLTPLLDYGLASGTGVGALLAIPHLQAAAALLPTST